MRTRGVAHQETKERILQTARGLVLEHGHESLSLREIARKAGFGPASLYEYFDSKSAIVQLLACDASTSLKAALERSANGSEADADVLVALGLAYVDWAKEHPEDFVLLFGRLQSKRKSCADDPALQSPYRVVLDSVRRVAQAGGVSANDPSRVEQLAYALWATAHGIAMLQLTELAGVDASFTAADRTTFQALLAGWS